MCVRVCACACVCVRDHTGATCYASRGIRRAAVRRKKRRGSLHAYVCGVRMHGCVQCAERANYNPTGLFMSRAKRV